MYASLDSSRFRPSPEIESLGKLASLDEIRGELSRAASNFGKINSILSLAQKSDENTDRCGFLVCFEKTMDALAASRQWRCVLFGFTTVVVFVNVKCDSREIGG